MIDAVFFIVFLSIIAALIIFFLRQRGSYFKPVQILFIVSFASFAVVIFCDFIKNYVIQEGWAVYYTSALGITAVLATAVAVEHASFILYRRGHCVPQKKKCTKLNLISASFKGYSIILLVVSWVLAPWTVTPVRTLWGGTAYSANYNGWFLYLLGGFLAFVMLYPCGMLLLSSHRCREKTVSNALAWLGVSWAATGFSLMFFNGFVRALGYEAIEIGYTVTMFFFAMIAYHFTKTTILEQFFEVPRQVLHMKDGEHLVVFYTSNIDKMKIFADYISEGLQRGDRVVYGFPDEEDNDIRLRLTELGVDAERYEQQEALILMGLSKVYLSNGHFDKEKLIEFWKRFKEESKRKGFKSQRDLIDLGNLSFLNGDEEKYLDYLREANAEIMDTYLTELRAINAEKVDHKVADEFRFLTTKSMDLLEHQDRFSKQLGLMHQELGGRTMLLEISPVSNYESLIQDFALEAAANIEPITVFTTRGSGVHSVLGEKENARFFLLTQLVSSPQANGSEDDMLLPAKNTSLLLDALDKTLRVNANCNQNIVFDNLSALALTVGFEKTFSFVQYAIELLSVKKSAALFLFSPSAHDSKVVSGMRSLFNDQMQYGEKGLKIVKLYEPQTVKMDVALIGEVKNEKRK